MSKLDLAVYPVIFLIFVFIAAAYFGRGTLLNRTSGANDTDGFEKILSETTCNTVSREYEDPISITSTTEEMAESVPVLVYHGISVESPLRKDDIHLCTFIDHMYALKKDGYETIGIQDFFEFVKGEKQLPDKSFLLTFDDGQRSSYYLADQTLEELDYNAVMFIITKHSLGEGSSYYLSIDEVNEMLDSARWEIQSHGKDSHEYVPISAIGEQGHFLSNRIWLDSEKRLETRDEFRRRIGADFRESKEEIEHDLGVRVIAFAFPFGDFGQGSVNLAEAEDFIRDEVKSVYSLGNFFQVFPAQGYTHNYPDDTTFMIKRIKVQTDGSRNDLIEILDNGRQKELPYIDTFSSVEGWTPIWGEIFVEDGLNIQTSIGSQGSAAFLDGSYLWKDYQVEVDIRSFRGQSVGLITRYINKEDHLVCVFDEDSVRIEQRLNDKIRTLAKAPHGSTMAPSGFTIGARVDGSKAGCILNGTVIVETSRVSGELSLGGIGLKSFDPKKNVSKLIVNRIFVNQID